MNDSLTNLYLQQGKAAYSAYVQAVGGLTWDGKPCPTWDQLTDKIRAGWVAAAVAAHRAFQYPSGWETDID